MATSTAYILVKDLGWKYTFDGVLSIAHSLALQVSKDSDSSEGTDYINNARNEPDIITLSVVASDANSTVVDWSASVMRGLAYIKENRLLCKVVTSLKSYDNMLLTDMSILQDESYPYGWSGVLTFTHIDVSVPVTKTDDNSSTPVNSGNTAPSSSNSSNSGSPRGGSTFLTVLREAGIRK